ncbi:MAG: hypothetical protein V7754_23020, partial [Halioglobus sp.]
FLCSSNDIVRGNALNSFAVKSKSAAGEISTKDPVRTSKTAIRSSLEGMSLREGIEEARIGQSQLVSRGLSCHSSVRTRESLCEISNVQGFVYAQKI